MSIVKEALDEAGLTPADIDAIAFTKARTPPQYKLNCIAGAPGTALEVALRPFHRACTSVSLHPANAKPGKTQALSMTRSAQASTPPSCLQGPGMGGPLLSCAVCARMLSLMWKVPIIGVNHCVGAMHITLRQYQWSHWYHCASVSMVSLVSLVSLCSH